MCCSEAETGFYRAELSERSFPIRSLSWRHTQCALFVLRSLCLLRSTLIAEWEGTAIPPFGSWLEFVISASRCVSRRLISPFYHTRSVRSKTHRCKTHLNRCYKTAQIIFVCLVSIATHMSASKQIISSSSPDGLWHNISRMNSYERWAQSYSDVTITIVYKNALTEWISWFSFLSLNYWKINISIL